METDNGIIFLTLAMICCWLVLDNFLGNGYIKNFVGAIFE